MHIDSNWAMVIITGIYVAATIVIVIVNIMSIREMKREFNSQIRLTNCPHLVIQRSEKEESLDHQDELVIGDNSSTIKKDHIEEELFFVVRNIGGVSAQNVHYRWDDGEKSSGVIMDLAPEFSRKACLRILYYPTSEECGIERGMIICFTDPLGNRYKQYVSFYFIANKNMVSFEKCIVFPVQTDNG